MVMNKVERLLSRPAAKPYRTKKLDPHPDIYLNENGHLDFCPGDIENPRNWSFWRKGYITVSACILVVNATFASAAPSGCLESLARDFHISVEAAGLTITMYLLGYVFGPLFFAPLSEFYGRRWIFYITFSLYCIFNFLCAYSPTFGGLLVGRFLTGTFASAPMSNAPGVLADLWGPVGRGNAIALFAMMTFIGPALGPVIGGFMELKKDWRWIYYVILMMSQATLIPMFTIPETLPSVVLQNKARRIRKLKIVGYEDVISPIEASTRSLKGIFKIALTRPWIMLMDPIAMLIAIYLSIVYSLLYMLFTIYPIVFIEKRGWNAGVGELPLLGVIVGAVIAGTTIFTLSSRDKKKLRDGLKITPEDRLLIGMIGGIGFALTMFWFALTAQFNSIHWIVPTLAGVFLSTSILMVFVSFLNYLTDTYLMYAASAMACNTIARSAAGAATPLYTEYMFHSLGIAGGGCLVGGVAALLAIIPFAFYKYGPAIRARSRFAPTPAPPNGLLTQHHLEKIATHPEPALAFLPLEHLNSREGNLSRAPTNDLSRSLSRVHSRATNQAAAIPHPARAYRSNPRHHTQHEHRQHVDEHGNPVTPASSVATTLNLSELSSEYDKESEYEKDYYEPDDVPENAIGQPAYETPRFGHENVPYGTYADPNKRHSGHHSDHRHSHHSGHEHGHSHGHGDNHHTNHEQV